MQKEQYTLDSIVKKVLEVRGGYDRVGINRNTWFTLKRNFQSGKLTYESKVELALKFGYVVKQPELWENNASIF